MNRIIIHGRLTKDPELGEYTIKNETRKKCKFTVAVDRRGEGTDFFNCITFGNLSEVIDKFFSKGKEIVVSGSMQCNPYDADDGKKRYPWTLIVNEFDFCGSKKDGDGGSGNSDNTPDGFEPIDDEYIPF